jgi:hypothetical protein
MKKLITFRTLKNNCWHIDRPVYIPMTLEDESKRGIEFDETIYCIEVAERQRLLVSSAPGEALSEDLEEILYYG